MSQTRITLTLDSELVDRLEAADRMGPDTFEEIIEERLRLTAGYVLTGAPLFLDDAQHRRLRSISGSAAIGGTEALLDRLEAMTRLSVAGEPLVLPFAIVERLASRAKLEGKTANQLAVEYATAGIRERIGL